MSITYIFIDDPISTTPILIIYFEGDNIGSIPKKYTIVIIANIQKTVIALSIRAASLTYHFL